MTLQKKMEQLVAFKFCVAEGTFSHLSIKTFKESEIISKNVAKLFCVIVYEKNGRFINN